MRNFIFLLVVLSCFACKKTSTKGKVLASTAWTAAYVKAAGVQEVELIAPRSLLHPSEYELNLSDLGRIKRAKVIVYAGYEVMVQQMLQGVDTVDTKLVRIETGFELKQIQEMVLKLAAVLNTEQKAHENIERIKTGINEAKSLIKEKGFNRIPVLVHYHQQKFAHEMGLNVVGVFGPNQPESYEIMKLLANHPVLIIDNIHNPVGLSLENSGKLKRIEWINFPGPYGTETIDEVVSTNLELLVH